MAPTLYYIDLSPPVRGVLLTEHALGLELEKKVINLQNGEHLTPEYLKINPQHTVPTLDDDGFCIWDSHVIAAYLVGKYGKDDSLYPQDLQKRAIVDQRLHFDSGILFPRLKAILFAIFSLGEKELSQENANAASEAFAFLEAFLENHKWMAGEQMTIADLCIGASVTSLATVHSVEKLMNHDKYPRLHAWLNRLKALPYYEEANGIGLEKLKAFVKTTLEK